MAAGVESSASRVRIEVGSSVFILLYKGSYKIDLSYDQIYEVS